MELFTNNTTMRELTTILENQLGISSKEMTNVVFKDMSDMTWLNFRYKGKQVRMILHYHTERFGFSGSLIKVEIPTTDRNELTRLQNLVEEIVQTIGISVGGLSLLGDEIIETFNHPGSENSNFLLKQLQLAGVDDEKTSKILEDLLDQETKK